MVMETPSPQCVGREFVRQYYTLLNEVPLHLHRFYSHNSSFVHGGVEKPGEEQPPVVGQAEIHKKIMSLNFRDCHAKIRQVDSQATVGNAVVVQVTGELSNNGQPMRRFMQTFVLAPQSPKKYYVHNDIFRYQDEVFHDDSDIENQEEDSDVETMASNPTVQESMQEPGVQNYYEQQTPLRYINGTSHLEDRVDSPSQKSAEEEKEEGLEPEQVYEEKELIDEEVPVEQETETQEEEPQNTGEPKPFSWAALASKNTSSSGQISQQSTLPSPPQQKTTAGPGFRQDQGAGPQPQRSQRSRERRDRDRLSASRDDGEVDAQNNRRLGGGVGGGGPPSRFPDSHQLFVGNLPQNVQESELRVFFEKFGTVVEVRINAKSVPGKVPNFGFVVFDSPGPVGEILRMRPLLFNENHRLNVEEKKPKEGRPVSGRGGGGPPRGMMGRGAMGNSGRGMRGGMGGRSDRGSMGGRGGVVPRR
ncbi:ras GTPase-activating protein-binding protein 2-like isoform X1 [Crassostrea virginica]